jgi:type IV pilus assembly protein PilN
MIRINLLPVRAAKKKETALQQISILVAGIVIVLAVVLTLWLVKLGQISSTKNDITAANAKITELKAKIGKLDQIKKLKDEVRKKLDVLSALRKNKTGPAARLATLSDMIPDRVWLEKYKENAGQVTVSGLAFDEELMAQFIRALEASSEYSKVELVVSEQKDISGTKLKRFDLTMQIETTVPAVQEQPKK